MDNIDESAFKTLVVTVEDGVQVIRLNRPEKRNAINKEMYFEIPRALKAGALDNSVVVTVLTGTGSYYCSGNDLSGFLGWIGSDCMDKIVEEAASHIQSYVQTFIDYPKMLIAVVNGPAVGLATTTLALCDLIYCERNATFSTPFTALGLSPEGCSSYTFPKIMGSQRAALMLTFGKKITAVEALEWGFVSELYSAGEESNVWDKINSLSKLPAKSLIYGKRLLRSQDRPALYEANRRECDQLTERWQSEDCMNAVTQFFIAKGSKL